MAKETSASRVACVVDDSPEILVACRRCLEGAGFAVITAANGSEALRVITRAMPPVDVVLLDLFMPEMDGFELINAIQESHPDVRIVAMSGGSPVGPSRHMLAQSVHLGAAIGLQKPFTETELLTSVRSLFE